MDVFELTDYENLRRIQEDKEVFLAKHKASKEEHVIKKINIPHLTGINDVFTEIIVHSRVTPHPNIVRILGRSLEIEHNYEKNTIEQLCMLPTRRWRDPCGTRS